MLNVFRENLRSLKWVLWLVALAMVLYLGDFFFGRRAPRTKTEDASAWAAKIDGEQIPAEQLFNLTRNLDAQYRQLFGDNYTQVRGSLRLGTQAANQLVDRALILDEAKRLGLAVGAEELAQAIQDDPAFKDATGQFIGAERYRQMFERRGGGGVGAFEQALSEELLIRRWEQMLGQSVAVADAEVETQFRERNDKTSIDYVIVRSMDQQISTDVDEAAIAAWYGQHPQRYRKDERRRVRMVTLKREALRSKVQVTDEDVRRRYEESRAKLAHPEQRRARHILFRVAADAKDADKAAARAKAEATLERVRRGEDFDKLARELSEDTFSGPRGGDLGYFGRGQMIGPFEDAAFGNAPGQLTPVVETSFGFHVLQVTDARPEGVTPFDEVADALRRELETQRSSDLVKTEAARVRAALDSAARLDEVAHQEGLDVETRVVTAKDPVPGVGPAPAFLEALFRLTPGEVSAPLDVPAGQALAVVDEVLPPGLAPLDEVRTTVRTDVLNDRVQRQAIRRAEEALARSADLKSAARLLAAEVRSAADLTPASDVPGAGAIEPGSRSALFGDAVRVGNRAVLAVPAGALLFQVTARTTFDPARFASEKPALREELVRRREGLLRQALLERLRAGRKIEINAVLAQRFDGSTS